MADIRDAGMLSDNKSRKAIGGFATAWGLSCSGR